MAIRFGALDGGGSLPRHCLARPLVEGMQVTVVGPRDPARARRFVDRHGFSGAVA